MKPKFILIVGKTCTGKDTLIRQIIDAFPVEVAELKNCTTRPKRNENEDTYNFLTHEDFTKKFFDNEFIEAQEYNGWFYGTLKADVRTDKINLISLSIERINLFYDYLKENNNLDNTLVIFLTADEQVRIRRYIYRLLQDNQTQLKDFKEFIRRFETEEHDYIVNELEDYPNVIEVNTGDPSKDYYNKYNNLLKSLSEFTKKGTQ